MSEHEKPKQVAAEPAPADSKAQPQAAAANEQKADAGVSPAGASGSATPAKLPERVAFEKVTKCFGHPSRQKVALENVSFVVDDLPDKGELITIVGPSGCGKSTLLRTIAALEPHYPPTTGEVRVFGKKISEPGADRGLVDQKYSLLPHLTVVENIAFGLKLRGVARAERRDRAQEWVRKVGLEGSEDKYPSELSGGMQQRVSIASTLILEPKILLMDEPFGALDPRIRLRMQELLIQLWTEQEETVFLVTHSVEEAVYLGDRVFVMGSNPGRLLDVLHVPRPDKPPEQMRREPWFVDFTQHLLRRLEEEPVMGSKAKDGEATTGIH